MTVARINLWNQSPADQIRVVAVPVPTAALDALDIGAGGVTKEGWLWERADPFGDQTRLWIRADLAGGERRSVDMAAASRVPPDKLAGLVPPFRTDWLFDEPAKVVLRIAVQGIEVALPYNRTEHAGALGQSWRFLARGGGFWMACHVDLPAGQDVFDCQGFVVWSDRRTQSVRFDDAQLEVRHGELHAPQLLASLGQFQPVPQKAPQVLLGADWIPDGFAVPFWFTLVATPAVAPGEPVGELRLNRAMAALGGSIHGVAGGDWWSGLVGPHRAKLSLPFVAAPSTYDLSVQRGPWDRRPNANAPASGTTGDQGIWGMIKAADVFRDGDPTQVLPLRMASTDYFARAHHHCDAAGNPLAFETALGDPKTTYNTMPFWRITGAAWGKNGGNGDPPFGWDHDRGPLDWQHRGNLYMPAALMLLGDRVLQDELDFLLASDARDTRWPDLLSFEAPRAAGRLLQEWAWWWCAAKAEQRKRLEQLADMMLAKVLAQPTYNVAGPMRWLSVFSRFDGKNPLRNLTDQPLGYEAASPWEHSFVVGGCLAWAAIYDRTGDHARRDRFLQVAVTLANVVVDGALIEDQHVGPIVCTYVKVNADGAPNPLEYFVAPRPRTQLPDGSWVGAVPDLNANCDLVFGGIALQWYAMAICVAGSAKALRIKNTLLAISSSQRDVEWLLGLV